MGRVTKVFASGSIGNAIFYERLGTACVRSRPARVKQTQATKAAAGVFGKAKSISKQLRNGLTSLLLNPKTREVMYVTDNAVAAWLRTGDVMLTGVIHPPLGDINFNKNTSFYERFKKQLSVDWSAEGCVTIDIPAFDAVQSIAAPAHTESIKLLLAVTASTLDGTPVTGSKTAIAIDYKQGNIPAKQVVLSLEEKENTIYLVVAALKYTVVNKGVKKLVEDEQWMPVSVLSGYFNN